MRSSRRVWLIFTTEPVAMRQWSALRQAAGLGRVLDLFQLLDVTDAIVAGASFDTPAHHLIPKSIRPESPTQRGSKGATVG